jgi:hypothetical protein
MTSAEKEKEKKNGLVVVLEWQPGPMEALSSSQTLPLGPDPMTRSVTGAGSVDGLNTALTQSHSPNPANPLM